MCRCASRMTCPLFRTTLRYQFATLNCLAPDSRLPLPIGHLDRRLHLDTVACAIGALPHHDPVIAAGVVYALADLLVGNIKLRSAVGARNNHRRFAFAHSSHVFSDSSQNSATRRPHSPALRKTRYASALYVPPATLCSCQRNVIPNSAPHCIAANPLTRTNRAYFAQRIPMPPPVFGKRHERSAGLTPWIADTFVSIHHTWSRKKAREPRSLFI